MYEKLEEYLDCVEDPRSLRNQRHPFMTLIGTSFLAALSGIDSFSGIQDFVEMHLESLSAYFDFPHGVPSHDTYQRLWDGVSPTQFKHSFSEFIAGLEKLSSDIISLDGKTIRNSGREKALHIVSAWCHRNHLVFGQEKVSSKSNEIKAIPKVLDLLDLENKVITIDAIGAQRSICQKIVDAGGDYVIALKGNQGQFYEDVKLYLQEARHHDMTHETHDKGHGRLECRRAAVSHQAHHPT